VQVAPVELRQSLQLALVEILHRAALKFDNAVHAELAQDAFGVNARHPHRSRATPDES
jgi:hypothetical protein